MSSKNHRKDVRVLTKSLSDYEKAELIAKEKKHEVILNAIKSYQTEEDRNNFVKELERTCFSKTKTQHIKKTFENFNEDSMKNNMKVVKEIIEGETHIECIRKQNEGFFTNIANVLPIK